MVLSLSLGAPPLSPLPVELNIPVGFSGSRFTFYMVSLGSKVRKRR